MMISMLLTNPSNDVVVFKPKRLVNRMVTDLPSRTYFYKIISCPSTSLKNYTLNQRKC